LIHKWIQYFSGISKVLLQDLLHGLLKYSLVKLFFLLMYVTLYFIKNHGIRLCISFAVLQLDSSVPISHCMSVKLLFRWNVLFLFSAYFHAFHRNFSFNVLDLNSYIEMSVARFHFSVWHSTWAVACWSSRGTGSPTLFIDGYSILCIVVSSMLCSMYHSWEILTIRILTHDFKLNVE